MKKIFLSIFSLFAVTSLSAQAYQALLSNFNEWKFTTCYSGCITDTYYTNGDTIVNGKEYKVLDGFHYISRTFLLREEVDNKKVFMAIVNELSPSIEYLMYDFSMSLGDSIDLSNPISPFPTKAGYFQLDSIVSRMLADGENYRHFYLSPTVSNSFSQKPATWVEGVGSLSMINAPAGFPDINDVGHLSCFFRETELVYSKLDSVETCEASFYGPTSIDDLDFDSGSISLRNGSLLCNGFPQNGIISLIDLSGRVIESDQVVNNQLEVNISNLSAGLYFVAYQFNGLYQKTYKVIIP